MIFDIFNEIFGKGHSWTTLPMFFIHIQINITLELLSLL